MLLVKVRKNGEFSYPVSITGVDGSIYIYTQSKIKAQNEDKKLPNQFITNSKQLENVGKMRKLEVVKREILAHGL